MAVPVAEQRLVMATSGNRCAFDSCRLLLTADDGDGRPVVLGEVAHIVGERANGPRGNSALSLDERNRYENLLALCNRHHQLVDAKPEVYGVERLRAMKQSHEQWVEKQLAPVDGARPIEMPKLVSERVHGTLLTVERMPRFVYGAASSIESERDITTKLRRGASDEVAPFIHRAGKLWAFQDLANTSGPFADVVTGSVERQSAQIWWDDPDRARWYIDLCNRALNKLTGHRGLMLDKEHKRYYFQPLEAGKPRKVRYRSLNGRWITRKVVWRRISRKTGEERGYWFHRAIALRFLRVGAQTWVLALRPEFFLSVDGVKPPASYKIGARVTRRKSQMFNHVVLGEVQLWRDYLSQGQPRVSLSFGQQHLVISSTLIRGEVIWPGIPEEYAQPFRNVEYMEDLWSWGELAEIELAESQIDELEMEDELDQEATTE